MRHLAICTRLDFSEMEISYVSFINAHIADLDLNAEKVYEAEKKHEHYGFSCQKYYRTGERAA